MRWVESLSRSRLRRDIDYRKTERGHTMTDRRLASHPEHKNTTAGTLVAARCLALGHLGPGRCPGAAGTATATGADTTGPRHEWG